MNSTGERGSRAAPAGLAARAALSLLAAGALWVPGVRAAAQADEPTPPPQSAEPPPRPQAHADEPMPRPQALERDVQFWIRVYTQIDTNAGFLHDQYNLGVVYDTLRFAPNSPPAERQRQVDAARNRYAAALRRIADAGESPLAADDQRIKELWGPEGSAPRLRSAVEDIRFQLGQADRFRSGLIRSGAWETHIAETLANLGLPAELAVLPHVESSFNPSAYSKVGAAGLWQFMRSTGRRYMRIDGAVDDRLDPFRSTEAAAQLLAYNYRVLGSWPLALTAYNHGTAGVRHAKETLATEDIARIVRSYTSRTFGFASRNFYVSFLAALEIDRNPEKYFGPLQKDSEARFQRGRAARLRVDGIARARPEDRRRETADAQSRAAAGGVERRAARAQGLPAAPAGRGWPMDRTAAGAAPDARGDVHRAARTAALSRAGRRYARRARRALRRAHRDAGAHESRTHQCAAAPGARHQPAGGHAGGNRGGSDPRRAAGRCAAGRCAAARCGRRRRICDRSRGARAFARGRDTGRCGRARKRRGRRGRRGRSRERKAARRCRRSATGVGGAGRGTRPGARPGRGHRPERRSHRLQRGARRHHSRRRGGNARPLRRLARRDLGAAARAQPPALPQPRCASGSASGSTSPR